MGLSWLLVQGFSRFSSQCVGGGCAQRNGDSQTHSESHEDLRKFSTTPRYSFQVTNRCSKDTFVLITQGTLAIERASEENCH